jgi:hypothetical protein
MKNVSDLTKFADLCGRFKIVAEAEYDNSKGLLSGSIEAFTVVTLLFFSDQVLNLRILDHHLEMSLEDSISTAKGVVKDSAPSSKKNSKKKSRELRIESHPM